MAKRTDNIFFLVLVDFFLQVIVLGLVIYAATNKRTTPNHSADMARRIAQLDSLKRRTGISDLTTLTDILTRLVPAESARGSASLAMMDTLSVTVAAHGGIGGTLEDIKRLETYEVGAHPCVSKTVGGRVRAVAVAEGILSDTSLRLTQIDDTLERAFRAAGIDVRPGRDVPIGIWPHEFGRLRRVEPNCSFLIEVVERTALRLPSERLWTYFLLRNIQELPKDQLRGK